jgi:type IX secretion system PorP/SprF family membrane protein
MKQILILLTLTLCTGIVCAQQNVQQSQYMFNGIYINPAYAGYKENLNVNAFYRSQWTGIQGAPTSTALAVDAIANDGNVGLALQISSDKYGAQNNVAAYANYAYRLRMNDDGSARLALGLGVGLEQLGINGNLLSTNDPEFYQPVGNQSVILPDARIGVYYSDNSVYAGLSADNLVAQYFNIKDHAYVPQPVPHFYITSGMLVPLSEDISLKPSILLSDDKADPTTLDLNTFVLFGDKIWVGGSYRTGVKLYNKTYLPGNLSQQNSVVAAVELFVVENMRIGYAYDFSTSALQGYSGGSHEISLSYYFTRTKDRIMTPRFF